MPYKVVFLQLSLTHTGHVVNTVVTAFELEKSIVVNPRVISIVVEPAFNGLTASTQGFDYPP